jgi:DnaJ family protein A protein 2
VVSEEKVIEVKVEPGMERGERIVLSGCADEAPGWEPGDVIVVIEEKPHTHFMRKRADLLVVKRLSLAQALCGQNIVITHLDGRKLILARSPDDVINPGDVRVIEGEGMPVRRRFFERGRLFVKFEVEFPKPSQVTDELRSAILGALPEVDECAGLEEDNENVSVVRTTRSDLKQFEKASTRREKRRREAYENQEEEDEPEQSARGCTPM